MAIEYIFEKLQREFGRGVVDECQVVFVLSRIRKYLDATKLKERFAPLYFYCNWALHTEIGSTKSIKVVLYEFTNHEKNNMEFVELVHFGRTLKDFLINAKFPARWVSEKEDWGKLKRILHDIYSDTPLFVKSQIQNETKKHLEEKITIKKESEGLSWLIEPKVIDEPFPRKWLS